MSHRALNPRQFFHGTNEKLREQDVLRPGTEIGKENWPGMDVGHSVWMHTNPEMAARYGRHVYEVQPQNPENYSEEAGHAEEGLPPEEHEWIAQEARVLRRVKKR